jgi:hypothetical protein
MIGAIMIVFCVLLFFVAAYIGMWIFALLASCLCGLDGERRMEEVPEQRVFYPWAPLTIAALHGWRARRRAQRDFPRARSV